MYMLCKVAQVLPRGGRPRLDPFGEKARPYQIHFMFHGSSRVFFLKIEKKKSKNAINMYT